MHSQVEHNHNVVVDTVRMQKAKKSGDHTAILEAMKEDVQELSVILDAVPDAQIIEVTQEE